MDARVTPANKSRIAALGLKGRKPAKRTILIDVHRKLDYALSKRGRPIPLCPES
jgi:hypothetical protein